MNTLSNTSSLPLSPVKVTVGLLAGAVVPVPTAPLAVPGSCLDRHPLKLAAPAMMPLDTAPEKVDIHCARNSAGGLSKL